MDILVSPNALVVTTISGNQFRTKLRRVTRMGVNFTIVAEVNDLSRRVFAGELDRFGLRVELRRLSDLGPVYNRWLVVTMVGLACAAFSRLFGGDGPVFFMTLLAAASAMIVRQELTHRFFNPFVVVAATAFVAGIIASLATVLDLSNQPDLALAASVLLLVPGVPLINSAEDLIQGHILIGLARGAIGGIISLAIALGLLVAIEIMGVPGL
jgi:uncharacterized membrane protein YjjP (DUF1212 family)